MIQNRFCSIDDSIILLTKWDYNKIDDLGFSIRLERAKIHVNIIVKFIAPKPAFLF